MRATRLTLLACLLTALIYAAGQVLYAPMAQRSRDVVAGGRRFENASITGTVPAMDQVRDLAIARGRFLIETDDLSAAQVAIIGADVADALFPAVDPLGQRMRIAGRGFTVVGLQTRQGTAGRCSAGGGTRVGSLSSTTPLLTYRGDGEPSHALRRRRCASVNLCPASSAGTSTRPPRTPDRQTNPARLRSRS